MATRIIVGPESMYVERRQFSSEIIAISASDGTAEIHKKAHDLYETIKPLVAWSVWIAHRDRMYQFRSMVARISDAWPGPWFAGPGPGLVSTRPWRDAGFGEWMSLPRGVAQRLLRDERAARSSSQPRQEHAEVRGVMRWQSRARY